MALQLMDTFATFVDTLAESLDDHAASGDDLAARAYLSRFHFDRVVGAALRVLHVEREPRIEQRLLDLQAQCGWLFRNRWHRLTLGMVAYLASLALLLWGCLTVTGTGLSPAAVLVAFTAERLLTLAGLTPGGAGIVEAGLAGVLVALGGDPVASVAGVLLYRVFTFFIEIPVGGVGLLAWLWARRRGLAW